MALKGGEIRFNTDTMQLEVWNVNEWTGILATSPEQQTGGTRGLIMGGIKLNPTRRVSDVEFITIDTTDQNEKESLNEILNVYR